MEVQKYLKPLEAADEAANHLDYLLSIFTNANIEMIVYEARHMSISSSESLSQCVDVIFDKAIDSENQTSFAILCTKLQLASVPVVKDSQKMITFKEQIHEKASIEVRNFLEKQTLLSFKKELENDKNSCYRRIKTTLALFRFIGELYIVDFLLSNFIEKCLSELLNETFCNENCLESFCAILKIAGMKLELNDEKATFDLSHHFQILAERKSTIVMNPHTRFMIEEICAMRKIQWQPVSEIDWITLYNLFLCDVEAKLYVLELWFGK